MAFISAYQLSGEHVISDLAYAFKHARVIHMGDKLWSGRMRGRNEIGGIPDGFVADIIQSERDLPMMPYVEYISQGEEAAKKIMGRVAEGLALSAMLDNTLWLGFYMSGGIGFSNTVATSALSGGANEDVLYEFSKLGSKYLKNKILPTKWDIVKVILNMLATYVIETYEKFPTLAELHWGGAHKTSIMGTVGAAVAAMLTGSSTMGLWGGNYTIAHAMKEGWLRTGWAGQEIQDHMGMTYLCSFRPEEGNVTEMHGENYPMHSYSAGHGNQRLAANYGAMVGRGSAWCMSPVVKVAFADPHLAFDFRRPRYCIAKAGIKEFMPDGERTVITPACDILDRGILKDTMKEFPA
jgi:methyl-coenzyme M reductase alpha subunit